MANDFLPCPFCGGADIRSDRHPGAGIGWEHRSEDVYSMCCYNCGATFPNRYRRDLLVECWNRRVALSAPPTVQPSDTTACAKCGHIIWRNGLCPVCRHADYLHPDPASPRAEAPVPPARPMTEDEYMTSKGFPPRKLVGYGECRCILTQYCDGKCRPIFEDVPPAGAGCDHLHQVWNLQCTSGHCKDCGQRFTARIPSNANDSPKDAP